VQVNASKLKLSIAARASKQSKYTIRIQNILVNTQSEACSIGTSMLVSVGWSVD
jgi:hypothetical protein